MANDDLFSSLYGFVGPTDPAAHPPRPNSTLLRRIAPGKRPSLSSPKGIKFLDAAFSEPVSFDLVCLPRLPGIYAILAFDLSCNPRPYRVLYFGKAADLGARVVSSHEKYDDWVLATSSLSKPYVAYHVMLGSTDWQRSSLEESLIRHYSPKCNVVHNFFSDFFNNRR